MEFRLSVRSAATAATANHCAAQLWNPSTAVPVWVMSARMYIRTAAVGNLAVKHTSARGATPTSSVTAAATNDVDGRSAPLSGAVLEAATFTTQPTLTGNILYSYNFPAAISSGFFEPFDSPNRHGILVAPGTGLAFYTPDAVVLPAADITLVCYE